MDWRAKSQSRSRSRAPDTMDWRAQSRSRSRAPDFRVAVAPPAVDAATATANFSRFYGDGSGSSTPTVATSTAPSSSSTPTSGAAQDSRSAHVQLAASLGLSPNPVESYNTNGFDQSVMNSFSAATSPPNSFPTVSSPPSSFGLPLAGSPNAFPTYAGSPGSFTNSYVGSPSFAFPQGAASPDPLGADPNLTAIENTLNHLINLQSLATNSGSQATSPASTAPSPAAPTAKGATFINTTPANFNSGKSVPNDYSFVGGSHMRKTSQDSYASLAQQGIHNLASVSVSPAPRLLAKGRPLTSFASQQPRRTSHTSPPAAAASPAASGSSAYMNAATLASNSRPFAFANATSPNASGISLGRPSVLTDTQSSLPPTPAAYFSQPPSPFAYASSAPGPGNGFVGSPAASLYGEPSSIDPNQALYDYFAQQNEPGSGYASPSFLPPGSFDNSAPTHVNPSHLLAHLQQQAGHYDSDNSSWGVVSPPSGNETSRTGTPSPPDGEPGASTSAGPLKGAAAKVRKNSAARSASSPDLVALGQSLGKGKPLSAPVSRNHSRSNTLSMPATVPEGKVPDEDVKVASTPAPSKPPKSKDSPSDDNPTRCLNCSTTVSLLTRLFTWRS